MAKSRLIILHRGRNCKADALFSQHQPSGAVGGDVHAHPAQVAVVEGGDLLVGHGDPCTAQSIIEHRLGVEIDHLVKLTLNAVHQRLCLDGVAGAGVEVVQIAVVDALLVESYLDVVAALDFFHHDEEVNVAQVLDEGPVVAVAGDEDDGVHVVGVDLLAGAGGQRHVHLRLALVDAGHLDVLQREGGEGAEYLPAGGGVVTVHQQDLQNFGKAVLGQTAQRRRQLGGVGIFAVHHHDGLLALVEEGGDVVQHDVAHVLHQAEVSEIVLVGFVEQADELFVAVEDVAVGLALPVHVALVGVAVAVFDVLVVGGLETLGLHAVGHEEQGLDVVPAQPVREERLAVADAVAQLLVDGDEVGVDLRAALLQGDAVLPELIHGIHGDEVGNGADVFQVVAEGGVDVPRLPLKGCADAAEIANDAGVFVLFQPLIVLHFWWFVFVFKVTLFHADKIGDDGNDVVFGVVVVCVASGNGFLHGDWFSFFSFFGGNEFFSEHGRASFVIIYFSISYICE